MSIYTYEKTTNKYIMGPQISGEEGSSVDTSLTMYHQEDADALKILTEERGTPPVGPGFDPVLGIRKKQVKKEVTVIQDTKYDHKVNWGKILYSAPSKELIDLLTSNPDNAEIYIQYCATEFAKVSGWMPDVKLIIKRNYVIGLRFEDQMFSLEQFVKFVKATFGLIEG